MEYVEATKELEHVRWYLSFAQQLNAMFICSREHTNKSCKEAISHIESMLTSLSHFSTTDIIDDAYPFVSETFYKLRSSGLPSRKPPHIVLSEVISTFSTQLSLARDYATRLLDRQDFLELLRLLPALSLQPLSPSLRSLLCACFRSAFSSWQLTIQALFFSARLRDGVFETTKSGRLVEEWGLVGMAGE